MNLTMKKMTFFPVILNGISLRVIAAFSLSHSNVILKMQQACSHTVVNSKMYLYQKTKDILFPYGFHHPNLGN